MQTAGDTAMPPINELLPTTVASASVLAPLTTQAVAKTQPRTGGYNKRSCQGSSSASMAAHQDQRPMNRQGSVMCQSLTQVT